MVHENQNQQIIFIVKITKIWYIEAKSRYGIKWVHVHVHVEIPDINYR